MPILLGLILFFFINSIGAEEETYVDFIALISVPTIGFESGGKYIGQRIFNPLSGEEIANGIGTFVSDHGRVLYAGKWMNGYMHGIGQRYYPDGKNFSGQFSFNQLHGRGQIVYPNGDVFKGNFVNNQIVGSGSMTYSNGDVRNGTLNNGLWTGIAEYRENGESDHERGKWDEVWIDGTYEPSVKIFKEVMNNYTTVTVKIICKAHNRFPIVKLFKENLLLAEKSVGEGKEIHSVELTLPFSDDAFTLYTCQTENGNGIPIRKKLEVRNPFFLQSNGECGLQLERRRKRRSVKRPFIISGRDAFRGQVPWQAIINVEGLGDVCGGSVISAYHVLTAAHCVLIAGLNVTEADIVVKLGYTTRPIALNGKDYTVKKVYIHPQYEHLGLYNDIALLALNEKIKIGKYVNPVCLPPRENFPIGDLRISGFGTTFNASNPEQDWFIPHRLQVSDGIQVLDLGECFEPRHERLRAFQGHFCAGFPELPGLTFRPDSCDGDSGGPATFKDPVNQRHYLVGLVSAGVGQCGAVSGSIYVNISHYLDWIDRVRLHELAEDYFKTNGLVPYDKIDGSILRTMFDFMSKNLNSILLK